ncbi:hypothetical protein FRC12_004014 [Ceratobasidium sp. 428]|nr:hypothetical protein FRC12_004014 [Ceratobasidium sp. 428]
MQRQKPLLEKLGKTRAAIEKIGALGNTVAQLLPASEAALAICSKAWEKLEAQEDCDTSIKTLIEGLTDIFPHAEAVKKIAKLPQLQNIILSLLGLVEDASRFILEYKADGKAVQTLQAFTKSSAHEQVEEILEKLQQLKMEFDRGLRVQTLQTVDMNARYTLLDKLVPVGQARYDSTRACMHGTRTNIIQNIAGWAQSFNGLHGFASSENLLWLHGHAGLGKSAIATSVCQLLDDKHLLAASFFCKRDDPQRRDPQRVLATVIHGLAVHNRSYADALTSQIQQDGSLCTSPKQMQYEKLIRDTLGSSAMAPPGTGLVVIVDALDECDDEDKRQQLLRYFQRMSQLVTWLKIVITSRPYKHIEEVFHRFAFTTFSTRDLFQYDPSDDIRAFIGQRLLSSKKSKLLPADTADTLSQRTSGLFIWAHTVCQFILNSYNPRERLNTILESNQSSYSPSALDNLYSTTIRASMDDDGEDNIRIMKQCLGAIIVCSTRTPLSVTTLSNLLSEQMDEEVLQSVVDSLGSVLYIDHGNDAAVRVYHPSFADYMLSYSRSGEFCVNVIQQHTLLAEACLMTMTRDLRFNICGLETSYKRNRDVEDLDERIKHRISRHLGYSCLYWASHLIEAEREAEILPEGALLKNLLTGPGALYWIEVLSLQKKLAAALPSIQNLRVWCKGTDLSTHAKDLYHFVRTFYYPISESTPHLYVSGLAFSPLDTSLTELRKKCFPKTIRLLGKTTQGWSPWLQCISNESKVLTVAISPDGCHIASGSSSGIVRTWDINNGALTGDPFVGHSAAVASVAFSSDGRRIVSGSFDYTIHSHRIVSCASDGVQIWDVAEFTPIGKLHSGHSFDVTSAAFSPDGHRIASGSKDKTVRIWDTRKIARTDTVLAGHSGHVTSVTFSPDGQRIASGSKDSTVRIWDVNTSPSPNISLVGHSAWVNCVTFSPSGQYVISGSNDNTIRVWDAEATLTTYGTFAGHSGEIHCVAFSPDGRRVVSGSVDKTIRVWDASTGAPIGAPLVGHKKQVNSVAFSPDGLRIVSASDDQTLRLWDLETGAPVRKPLTGHHGVVSCVAFSPIGCRVASGSWDKQVRIWDTSTGLLVGKPLTGHSSWIECVSFSNDGHLIISGSTDNTIRVWDVDTSTLIGEPFIGHSDWVTHVAFLTDDRIVSSSLDQTVRVWDVHLGTMISHQTLPHKYRIRSMVLSPDGRYAASGSDEDRTVRIWNAVTGTPVGEALVGHSKRIRSVTFSPDSQYVASCSDDGTMRVWNTISDPTRIARSVSRISVQCAADGWMYAGENELLFWLPPECRRSEPDDALFSVASHAVTNNAWLDYSDFVHGTDWMKITQASD